MTPGGNPIYKCSCCGKTASMGADSLCWCGFLLRGQSARSYVCKPFSILKEHPEFEPAFRACGCEPGRQEVGIMLERDYRAVMLAAAPKGKP
jgi:hypothetical protein